MASFLRQRVASRLHPSSFSFNPNCISTSSFSHSKGFSVSSPSVKPLNPSPEFFTNICASLSSPEKISNRCSLSSFVKSCSIPSVISPNQNGSSLGSSTDPHSLVLSLKRSSNPNFYSGSSNGASLVSATYSISLTRFLELPENRVLYTSSTRSYSHSANSSPNPNQVGNLSSPCSNPNDSQSDSTEKPQFEKSYSAETLKHQEIEGPTVQRDLSALANETREVLGRMRKSMYDLSRAMALLGLMQLTCGAWIAWITKASPVTEVSIQSIAAFAFPFSFAFLLRRTLKPVVFFNKMEEQGRLQILTLALQVAKSLDLLFRRTHATAILCVAGVSIALLVTAWSH
ncbi:uncharacterized protein LOC18439946 [Amborella trichopoda]|uniref:Uncharacterized protein n=1 Tax=Amborella trichopoda TaxID=13333 RepID=W1PWL4_AMBTC|nr:uncharacterized protein LOC18439946 [Amborella trichopoda]ERN11745.1 hypothetical protein AMTR_s00022p00240900 [Amborella trichopoda]|eukprot:XP_006850164.1 uncharacterized protein LOC18439946 [Amborella trichopoda]